MKLLSLKTVNATQTILTISFKGAVFTVSYFKGVLGTKMKKYFGTQVQIRPVARNRKGHFVSIKGLESQILNLISYLAAKPVIIETEEEVKNMKTEVQLDLGTNVSNNQVKKILADLGVDSSTVNLQFLKTMNSKVDALEIILESITSIVQPSNLEVDILGIINNLCSTTSKIGNYSGEHIASLLIESWKDNAKDLHVSPLMHGAIKAWIIEAVGSVKATGFHKMKDLKITLFTLAIKHLQPLL